MRVKKTSILIILYSVMLTGVLFLTFYLMTEFFNNNTISQVPSVLYTSMPSNSVQLETNRQENVMMQAEANVGSFNKYSENIVFGSQIDTYYTLNYQKNLVWIGIIVCLVILISSFILWYVLQNAERKRKRELLRNLENIEDISTMPLQDLEMLEVYELLHDKFNNALEDSRILNSYITHEQKNMFALLKAKVDTLEEPSLSQDIRELNASMDDILTLSTKEATHLEKVDLALIVADICECYQKIYPNIEFSFCEEEEMVIMGRDIWLQRMVSNLIENAIKFGEEKTIEVNIQVKHNTVILTVQDHGIGIEEAKQERIFDPNYRIQELKKDGYGIGLSLVKHVCQLCKGISWVESQKGKGTTFYLSFRKA